MKLYELTDAFQELYVNDELTNEEVGEKLQALFDGVVSNCSASFGYITLVTEFIKAED